MTGQRPSISTGIRAFTKNISDFSPPESFGRSWKHVNIHIFCKYYLHCTRKAMIYVNRLLLQRDIECTKLGSKHRRKSEICMFGFRSYASKNTRVMIDFFICMFSLLPMSRDISKQKFWDQYLYSRHKENDKETVPEEQTRLVHAYPGGSSINYRLGLPCS